MKFSTVLVYASLAFATPTPIIEKRSTDAVNTIYDIVKDLEKVVLKSNDEISYLIKKSKYDSDFEIVPALEEKLEAVASVIIKSIGILTGQIDNDAEELQWLKEFDEDDVERFLETIRSGKHIAAHMTAIFDNIDNLPRYIERPFESQAELIKLLLGPYFKPLDRYIFEAVKLGSEIGLTAEKLDDIWSTESDRVGSVAVTLGLS